MKIVHLSYAQINEYKDPHLWLSKLSFYVGILEAMAKYGSVHSIHCISYTGILTKNSVKYHFLRRNRWQFWFPFGLHSYLKKLHPDAIIIHGLIFPWQVIVLRWQLGKNVKIILQHHAERPFKDVRKYLQRWADRYVDAYLFCSKEQGMLWVSGQQIYSEAKVKEIMGTSSPFYVVENTLAMASTKAKQGTNFLWVGRLDANKDPLIVVRAFIRFRNLNPSVNLYMIYQTFQLLKEVESLVAHSEYSDCIHLLGKMRHDELLYWYNSVDFIISSSHYEGSGVAVCEGLSCGCIPILSNIPSFRMMSDNGRIGLLFEPGNEDDLLHCLSRSMALDRDDQKRLVLEQFHNKLSFEANANSITGVVQSLHTSNNHS